MRGRFSRWRLFSKISNTQKINNHACTVKRRLHEQFLCGNFYVAIFMWQFLCGNFYVTIFMWQFLFVRVDEENCPIFMWQIHLICHTRKIARVDYSSFKMWQIIAIIGGPQPPTGCSTR